MASILYATAGDRWTKAVWIWASATRADNEAPTPQSFGCVREIHVEYRNNEIEVKIGLA